MNFEEVLRERTDSIQAIVEKYLPEAEGFQFKVIEAMNYSILAGGKRLRPLLMQETWRLFGGEGAVIEPFMAAIEMIHTHSLIHDDLPAMDNDEYRRGRKTTWAQYGEAMGILAGAKDREVHLVEQIASDVGMAFQIQDDILDVTSTTEELGKPVRSDEKNEKTTYVTLKGIQKAKEDVERISRNAISMLDSLDTGNEFLRELIVHLINRRK